MDDYSPRPAIRRPDPLFLSERFPIMKDPCPVFDGTQWHIYATGSCLADGTWQLLHATAPTIDGPWQEVAPVVLAGLKGGCIAAPGVIYSRTEKLYHIFIQATCFGLEGEIFHLTSADGDQFDFADVALTSIPASQEAGIYDSHPAEINGEKYLTYSGMPQVGRPDIYLVRSLSGTWDGPWQRLGCIMRHADVPFHNQHNHPDYEWGLEGSQIVELPDGKVLLNAVCFLPDGSPGERQRVFYAVADTPEGPYAVHSLGLDPLSEGWESGENGHAAAIFYNGKIHLFYQAQARRQPGDIELWKFGKAEISPDIFNGSVNPSFYSGDDIGDLVPGLL